MPVLRKIIRLLPYGVILAAAAWIYAGILAACEGHFVYSLDDPYIHLALAEQIAQGWYGIEPGIPSAPSSSILWPFLLAPFARLPFFDRIPIAINLLAALGCVGAVGRGIDLLRGGSIDAPMHWMVFRLLFQLALIAAVNVISVCFTGMEHILHIWLCALLMVGFAHVLLNHKMPRWFLPVCILAPGLRYESLAVVLPILLILLLTSYRKSALTALAGIILTLGAYSLWLFHRGLGFLPSSVLSKSRFLVEMAVLPDEYTPTLSFPTAMYLLCTGTVCLLIALRGFLATRNLAVPEVAFSAVAATVACLHLLFGRFGWWGRYEPYALLSVLLLLMFSLQSLLQRAVRRALFPTLTVVILVLALPIKTYWLDTLATPLASANIYQQQYQMHRLAVDFLRAPVAVNDLGYVSFRNPYPVLDLWGLGSREALQKRSAMRRGELGTEWMEQLVQENNVRLVMIYDRWLPHPPGWQRVGRLYLGVHQASAGDSVVSLYSVDPAETSALIEILLAFQPTLPVGVRLVLD